MFAAGSDYVAVAPEGVSNLRWRANSRDPNNELHISIISDNVSEPVEHFEIVLTCDGNENCYIPRDVYQVAIIDPQGNF